MSVPIVAKTLLIFSNLLTPIQSVDECDEGLNVTGLMHTAVRMNNEIIFPCACKAPESPFIRMLHRDCLEADHQRLTSFL